MKFNRRQFPAQKYVPYEKVKNRLSLSLLAHHFSERPVRPLMPTMIEIGGIQMRENPSPLPADVASFLNAKHAQHGVIYFSLGTNLKKENLQPDTLFKIFNVLSKLPQMIVWNYYDQSNIPGNASNILFKKWLHQSAVLSHPNVRLFFIHGGKAAIAKAQFYGVPMMGLPISGDQAQNMDIVQCQGFGLFIDPSTNITETLIAEKVNEVLHNGSYRNAIRKFSSIYLDRPLSAKKSAVFWLEYVMRHKGAPHMQSPVRHMSFMQANNLDIFGLALLLPYAFYTAIKLVVYGLYKALALMCHFQ